MYGLILQYDIKWTTVYLGRLRGVEVIENLATGILHHEMFWTRKKVNDVSHCYVSMLMGVVNNSSTKIGLKKNRETHCPVILVSWLSLFVRCTSMYSQIYDPNEPTSQLLAVKQSRTPSLFFCQLLLKKINGRISWSQFARWKCPVSSSIRVTSSNSI